MPFANYTELQAAIQSWLEGDALGTTVPDLIALAEAKFNREIKNRKMHALVEASFTSEDVTLPADFVEIEAFATQANARWVSLRYFPPPKFEEIFATATGGWPRYYTVYGDTLRVAPIPDGAYNYRLAYIQKIPALSDTNPTNWLLTEHPDIYLYGSLVEAEPFLDNDERVGTWLALYLSRRKSLAALDMRSRYRPESTMQTDMGEFSWWTDSQIGRSGA